LRRAGPFEEPIYEIGTKPETTEAEASKEKP
jgi:hypothetical protein